MQRRTVRCFRGLERDDFSSNRHHTLTCSWSMIFFQESVSTFRDHAPELSRHVTVDRECREPEVRTTIAASPIANFGFKAKLES